MTQVAQLRVVLDANQIIAAGTAWLEHGAPSPDGNASRRLLIRVAQAHAGLYCGKIVGEYLEKLVDRGHPRDRCVKMMAYIMGAFSPVDIHTQSAPVKPTDPDDEVFLLCALDGDADYLVSDDHSLTSLSSSYTKPVIGRCLDVASALGA